MTTVQVPPCLSPFSMHRLLDAAIEQDAPIAQEIVFDFSRIYFIESVGVVILSNLVEWLRSHGVVVRYQNANLNNKAIAYLDDIGFFEAYWNSPISPYAKLRDTTFSFRALHCSDAHQWIDGSIFPWLRLRLNCADSALYQMKASVREVFNNIVDHSQRSVGCMHVQWHPNINTVKIAISDFGTGIPNEVRKVMPGASDAQALHWATLEGNSSKKGLGSRNMGVGLAYLIENVTKCYNGWLGIYSGKAGYAISHKADAGSLHALSGVYPGTLINMILRTGNLPIEQEEKDDFQW